MPDTVYSVSQVNEYLSRKLWNDPFLSRISVLGEVTNFGMSSAGHAFFSLKDEESTLDCIMHDFLNSDYSGIISGGALVQLYGRITYYKKNGSVQLIVEKASLQGAGSLFERFERTKKKLYEEGIFDAIHKKALPEFPLRIGIVTSSSGAVMHDIIVVATRRFEGINIAVYPVQVQGKDAARQICEGISYFNKTKSADVIIAGRGGGSFEDLFAFNEECVARAVFESDIPVISAVGHETDYSLCDMAADLRAPTPSAAAELAVKEKDAVKDYIKGLKNSLSVFQSELVLEQITKANALKNAITAYPFELIIDKTRENILSGRILLKRAVLECTGRYGLMLDRFLDSLKSLNPKNVLERGYAIIYDENDNVISSKKSAADNMSIEFADGRVSVHRKEK